VALPLLRDEGEAGCTCKLEKGHMFNPFVRGSQWDEDTNQTWGPLGTGTRLNGTRVSHVCKVSGKKKTRSTKHGLVEQRGVLDNLTGVTAVQGGTSVDKRRDAGEKKTKVSGKDKNESGKGR